jgi:hypothetical protein
MSPNAASASDALYAGSWLYLGDSLLSPNQVFRLIMQPDGNLVLYNGSWDLWSSNTGGRTATGVTMQTDGNLVIYNGSSPVWDSGTGGRPPATYGLYDQNDGNVVIYAPGGAVVWATWTSPQAPLYGHSWYVTDPSATAMYNLGKLVDGPFDYQRCANSLVVLNFGQPDFVNSSYGTRTHAYGSPFSPNTDIIVAAQNYARGWYEATSTCPTLKLVVGTNNYNQIPSGGGTPSGAGSNWAYVVASVQNYLVARGYSWQISAWAGSDMEQPGGVQVWDCADKTRQFVAGYNANSVALKFLNFGSAWVPNPADGSCWNASDVYYVSWQAPKNYPLPQAYFGSAVDSWVTIRRSYQMTFEGIVATCNQSDPISGAFCQLPSGWFTTWKGWRDLWEKLNAYGVGQAYMNYATNIRYQ